MGQLTRAQAIGIVALLSVVTGWVGVTALHAGPPSAPPGIVVREAPPASGQSNAAPISNGSAASPAPSLSVSAPPGGAAEIVVHVAGAVKKPGVYHLPSGARNDDAVKAAGGFTAAANPDAINLAAHCEDGVQLYLPTRAERPSGGAASQEATALPASASVESSGSRPRAGTAKSGKTSGRSSDKLSGPAQGQIDLNTADSAQLQRIPGIGPAMAERILAYRRTAGRFRSPDELMQVSGIGDKKYQKMRPFLTAR